MFSLVAISIDGAVLPEGTAENAAMPDVLEATLALYARKGLEVPWGCYLAVENEVCVGTCGFTGPPEGGEVEIAYFTFPEHEGRGVATRMASCLMRIAEDAHSAGVEVVAHTMPGESPSCSILRKVGFILVGEVVHPEDGTVWKWRRPNV